MKVKNTEHLADYLELELELSNNSTSSPFQWHVLVLLSGYEGYAPQAMYYTEVCATKIWMTTLRKKFIDKKCSGALGTVWRDTGFLLFTLYILN